MACFDVYRRERKPGFLLDCQADILADFDTRFVVPLLPAARAERATRLHPVFAVEGAPHIMATQLAGAVPVRVLGEPVASLVDEHAEIMNALDMLLTGY
jgi:toxin CcdB